MVPRASGSKGEVIFTAEHAENAESEDGRTLSAFHLPRTQVPGSAVRGFEERQE